VYSNSDEISGTQIKPLDSCHQEGKNIDLFYFLRSPAKHGRLGFILSWIIPKTLKMVSAAALALTLSISELLRR